MTFFMPWMIIDGELSRNVVFSSYLFMLLLLFEIVWEGLYGWECLGLFSFLFLSPLSPSFKEVLASEIVCSTSGKLKNCSNAYKRGKSDKF